MRRRLTLLIGVALLAASALPTAAADTREPREPRKPGEARSGSTEDGDGGPVARSGDASASNSASVSGGSGHISQSTQVSTGDVVVGGRVTGTTEGGGSPGTVSELEESTPSPTIVPTPKPTPAEEAVSGERIDAEPTGDHGDAAAGPDLATWIVSGVLLLGFAIAFRRLRRPDPS